MLLCMTHPFVCLTRPHHIRSCVCSLTRAKSHRKTNETNFFNEHDYIYIFVTTSMTHLQKYCMCSVDLANVVPMPYAPI